MEDPDMLRQLFLATPATVALLSATVSSLRAQTAGPPSLIYACYIPQSGVMYRVGAADLRAQTPTCVSPNHVLFSWNSGPPASAKTCDGIDNNQNGQIDDGLRYCTEGQPAINTVGDACLPGFVDQDGLTIDGCEYQLHFVSAISFQSSDGQAAENGGYMAATVGERVAIAVAYVLRPSGGAPVSGVWGLEGCFGIAELRPSGLVL